MRENPKNQDSTCDLLFFFCYFVAKGGNKKRRRQRFFGTQQQKCKNAPVIKSWVTTGGGAGSPPFSTNGIQTNETCAWTPNQFCLANHRCGHHLFLRERFGPCLMKTTRLCYAWLCFAMFCLVKCFPSLLVTGDLFGVTYKYKLYFKEWEFVKLFLLLLE